MSLIRKPTELSISSNIKMMIYGQAGMRKTSTAISAPAPLLLDFDNGVKRVNMAHLNGVDIVQVEKWQDILDLLKEDLSAYKTIVVDTIGKMMDYIITYKCGSRQPQIRDWSGINQEFLSFTRNLSALNKNIIYVAHRDTRKEGDETVFIPALREKSYNSIVTELDLLGYMEAKNENGRIKCTITFDPTSRNDGKNTCNLPAIMEVPANLDAGGRATAKNDFVSRCIIQPYNEMLRVKQDEIHRYNSVIEEIKDNIALITDTASANDFIKRVNQFEHIGSSLDMARNLLTARAKELGLTYDNKSKQYTDS